MTRCLGYLFAASLPLFGAAAAAAQSLPPAAADDPIVVAVTDGGGNAQRVVMSRREHEKRVAELEALAQAYQLGHKRFLFAGAEGSGPEHAPLVWKPELDRVVYFVQQVADNPQTPPELRRRAQERLRQQQDPAMQEAAWRALARQLVDLKAGLVDWTKVRGTLRGTFRLSCTIDGKTENVDGHFQLVLMGDGTVPAAFSDARLVHARADGTIDPMGAAAGSASGGAATVRWSASFSRASDGKLVMTQPVLEITPRNASDRCSAGSLALGDTTADEPSNTSITFPEPMDWKTMRGTLVLDDNGCYTRGLPTVYARWRFEFLGDGTVRGDVRTVRSAFNANELSARYPFTGTIITGYSVGAGYAYGNATTPEGEYTWELALRRPGNEHAVLVVPGDVNRATKLRLALPSGAGCTADFRNPRP